MDTLINELKRKMIQVLNLEGVTPDDIGTDDALFNTGLGLDSIDTLELVAMLENDYRITIQDRPTAEKAFASVRSLATFIRDRPQPCPGESPS